LHATVGRFRDVVNSREVMMHPGRHFLQIPGPTNTPLPVLAAVAKPTIDHRGPEFQALTKEVLAGIRSVFKTSKPVIIGTHRRAR
jgi:alanine-glyoxylate transaminase/serine-glyoxylate transaminase/serine-pyruvate transaminase